MSTTSFAARRRLAAIGALAAAGAGVFALLWGFTESPFAILIAMILLVGAFGFGWVALTRRDASVDRRSALRGRADRRGRRPQ